MLQVTAGWLLVDLALLVLDLCKDSDTTHCPFLKSASAVPISTAAASSSVVGLL